MKLAAAASAVARAALDEAHKWHRYVAELAVSGLLLALFILTAALYYPYAEGWSVLDSIYFCLAVLTTNGYGDLHPTSAGVRVFTGLFALFGMVAIVFALFLITDAMMRAEEAAARHIARASLRRIRRVGALVREHSRSSHSARRRSSTLNADVTSPAAPPAARPAPVGAARRRPAPLLHVEGPYEAAWHVARLALPVPIAIGIGMGVFQYVEGWSAVDAFYWAVSTVTGTGIGDVATRSKLGRAMACAYIPCAFGASAKVLKDIAQFATSQWMVRRVADAPQMLGLGDAAAAVSSGVHTSAQVEGGLTEEGFVVLALTRLYGVDPEVVRMLRDQFDALDRAGSPGGKRHGGVPLDELFLVAQSHAEHADGPDAGVAPHAAPREVRA